MAASPSQMLLRLAACWLLASLLPLAAGQAYFTYNNSYAPQVFYHDPNNVLPYRQYCRQTAHSQHTAMARLQHGPLCLTGAALPAVSRCCCCCPVCQSARST